MKRNSLQFLISLCVLNVLLNFLFVPVDGASDTMWSQYYEEEKLDTIFVGSSISATTFDPQIFNDVLGVKSFNMGTPAQAISQSIDALEVAFEEHEIQTVVMSVGFFSFQVEPIEAAEMSFAMGRANGKGGLAGTVESVRYLMSEEVVATKKSINYFFPWSYNSVTTSINEIYKNVLDKTKVIVGNSDKENEIYRNGKGYRPYMEEINLDVIWTENSLFYYSGNLEAKTITEFEELLELCDRNGVDLVVVNTPHPVHDVVTCYTIYEDMEEAIEGICRKHNVEYYNFSLAKPELFDNKPEYFHDCEHLNYQGSQVFSKMFCDFLQKRQCGEDIKKYFYTVDEFYDVYKELLEEWMER